MRTTKEIFLFFVALMIVIPMVFTSNVQAAKLYKKDAAKFRQVMNKYRDKYPYSIYQIEKFTLYDLNRDGRKDLIMSPCDPSAALSSVGFTTYIVMKVGKKYVSKKLQGEFVKAGSRSLLLKYSVKTYGKESAVKGVGHLDREILFKISKTGDFFLEAEYRHERDNQSAPYTTSFNDGYGNSIGVVKYNKLIKNAKLKKLSFKKMTPKNVKKVR